MKAHSLIFLSYLKRYQNTEKTKDLFSVRVELSKIKRAEKSITDRTELGGRARENREEK